MITRSLFFIFFATVLLISGCSKPVAIVNGKKIDRKMLDLQVKERLQEHQQQNIKIDEKRLRDQVLQELIAESLLMQGAEEKGIKVTDSEINKEIETIKTKIGEEEFNKLLKKKNITIDIFRKRTGEKILMTKFIQSLVSDDAVTDKDISEYYRNSSKPFLRPARVNMRMMEFNSEGAAVEAVKEIKRRNNNFDEVADSLAKENKAIVSNYGWVVPENFSPAIESAVKNMKAGQFGGPYKGLKSYYVIKVKDIEKERLASLDEVKDSIKSMILSQKRQEAIIKWIEERKRSARITINLK